MGSQNGNGLKLLSNAELALLIRYASEHRVSELEWDEGETRISLKIKPAHQRAKQVSAIADAPGEAASRAVRSPNFGVFHRPEKLVIGSGQVADEGQILAYVRLGPVLKAIRAPVRGTVKACGHAEGDLIGYGDTVFEIAPE